MIGYTCLQKEPGSLQYQEAEVRRVGKRRGQKAKTPASNTWAADRGEAGGRRLGEGGRRQEAGDRRKVAGGRMQVSGGGRQEVGGKRQAPGFRRQEAGGSWSNRLLPTCRAHTAAVKGRMLCLVKEK